MSEMEGFNFWWLIPLLMLGLCIFCAGKCCGSKGYRTKTTSENNDKRHRRIKHYSAASCCSAQKSARRMDNCDDDIS